ncbi:MAG TPA: hypothetical protein VH912_20095 [Streptosporangiaceae bacterium]|jgi:hypothetical protein
MTTPRIKQIADGGDDVGALLERLVDLAVRGLPANRVPSTAEDGEYVFTRRGTSDGRGRWRAEPAGRSLRYAAIVALGVNLLPVETQRAALDGETADELVDRLVRRLTAVTEPVTGLGDAALVCWAAAEAGHPELPRALERLADLDPGEAPVYTVDAAWVVSALAAARAAADVEAHLSQARARLLSGAARRLYAHSLGPKSLVPWYRAHVGCFADQVYPLQALARLHATWSDPPALAAAEAVAERICALQGDAGQWWWHYDARTGKVVEGYPVYSVHQHAMAPMALLDLAEAGGTRHADAIRTGLRWITDPAETDVTLIDEELALIWRKVARNDPRKLIRGLRAVSTRAGTRLAPLDHVFPPTVVDRECRPYELGWLLYAWNTSLEG